MFQFTDETRNKTGFNAYNYQDYKRTLQRLKLQKLKHEFDNVSFATFCKLKEICIMMNFEEPDPHHFGITQEQIDIFLKTDRYVSANLLLKQIEIEKKNELNQARKTIIEKYNKKKSLWWEFTKKGQRKHEPEITLQTKGEN